MENEPKNQIQDWLKKLEQESWQLELLVSAFTIFLLIQAIGSFSGLMDQIYYEYDLSNNLMSFVYIFMILINLSLRALAVFLIIHLLLRGFWIGSIGLRSVQSSIDFNALKYSDYFTDKIKKRVISLDSLVILLDEICSLIFSFAFLVMSILMSFGLFLTFFGLATSILNIISGLLPAGAETVMVAISLIVVLGLLLSGFIYFVDYLTLGFFKKYRWLSKIYYPIYRFYGAITLAVISRTIYYYLISKFSKKRIRMAYFLITFIGLFTLLIKYDQYQFFPSNDDEFTVISNYYDDQRPEGDYVRLASTTSKVVKDPFFEVFIRYMPGDNEKIFSNCPDITLLKSSGFNWNFRVETKNNNFSLRPQNYKEEDRQALLDCLSQLYSVYVNGSLYSDHEFLFYSHPGKNQKGIVSMMDSGVLKEGQNWIKISQNYKNSDGESVTEDFVNIPIWYYGQK